MKLSVIGLGKLGACTAACFAHKGFETLGVDISKAFVKAFNEGYAPLYEPGLDELIKGSRDKLSATMDYDRAVKETEVSFLIVPTPSREDGHFSNAYLEEALTELARALGKAKKAYHLIVITSTVSPGALEKELIPLIERESKLKLNRDFGICYNPEFIALGSVIHDFLNPDMVLLGESDARAGQLLASIYEKVCETDPHYARMSLASAEVTKISLNSYVTMKISFANTLAQICENIPGANIDDVTGALGADKRIAPYYLKGGLSYGGPCFPRDNKAFAAFAEELGVDAQLARATDAVNGVQVERLADKIADLLPQAPKQAVSILGLSYKPKTRVIEESPSIKIIEALLKREDVVINVYDPLALENTKAHFGDKVRYAASAEECVGAAPICVLATPDAAFKAIQPGWSRFSPTIVLDCWRILDADRLGDAFETVCLGIARSRQGSGEGPRLQLLNKTG